MNEPTTKESDRFHNQVSNEPSFKKEKMMEYAPEPFHMLDAKRQKLKFTVGKLYPLLQRSKTKYEFLTINDENEEMWIDEKYFTFDILMFDEDDDLEWLKETNCDFLSNLDIRKMASEKKIKALEANLDNHLIVLSGINEEKEETYSKPDIQPKLIDGLVKDTGNDLMKDASKCWVAIENVFGEKRFVNHDGILAVVGLHMTDVDLCWKQDFLYVNGAQTKITYEKTQKAYSGLTQLVSPTMAEKIVGKLIAKKLKKIF